MDHTVQRSRDTAYFIEACISFTANHLKRTKTGALSRQQCKQQEMYCATSQHSGSFYVLPAYEHPVHNK